MLNRTTIANVILLALLIAPRDPLSPDEEVREPMLDFNGNGIEDTIDIASATSDDRNLNGIPDECEQDGSLRRLLPSRAGSEHRSPLAHPRGRRAGLTQAP